MLSRRRQTQTRVAPANPNQLDVVVNGDTNHTEKVSDYEQCREQRIKENLERMQKLGIFDLSLKLKSRKPMIKSNFSKHKSPGKLSPSPASGPVRRSSRLQNVAPVIYYEEGKKDESLKCKHVFMSEGSRPEIYTEDHEKLLGSTEMSWTFFVDGYGKDGKRIYDPFDGKTCHQCRQKTLGHRTHCSECNMVQGQFCGDCLYMRYGEHVLEAKQNLNWVCPVCRGICNCSLCRQAKGWPPTGPLYKKISNLGFKSVAHYLIQTRRTETVSEENSDSNSPGAKRFLHLSEIEVCSEGKKSDSKNNDGLVGLVNPEPDDCKTNNDFRCEKMENNFSDVEQVDSGITAENDHQLLLEPKSESNTRSDEFRERKEDEMQCWVVKNVTSDVEHVDSGCIKEDGMHCTNSNIASLISSEPNDKPSLAAQPAVDGIIGGGMVRPRNNTKHYRNDAIEQLVTSEENRPHSLQVIDHVILETKASTNLVSSNLDTIAGRLKQRRRIGT